MTATSLASTAELGKGSILLFETSAGSGAYAELENCGDIPEFGDDFEEKEATHQGSPDNRLEYRAGLRQGQEFPVSCDWSRATVQEAIRNAQGTVRNFRIEYSTTPGLRITFPALIKSAKVSGPVKEFKKLMISLRVTGDSTEADI